MIIKQHPFTGIWCREDGAIVMHPSRKCPKYRWTFGTPHDGYRIVRYNGEFHRVHRLICETFCGKAPANKPFVDHINRIKSDNRASNLRWVSPKENSCNRFITGELIEIIEDLKAQLCTTQDKWVRERIHRCTALAGICGIKQRLAASAHTYNTIKNRRAKLLKYAEILKNSKKAFSAGPT